MEAAAARLWQLGGGNGNQLGGGGGSLAEGVIFVAKKIVGVIYKLIGNAQCDR